jgi:hypothetical protein
MYQAKEIERNNVKLNQTWAQRYKKIFDRTLQIFWIKLECLSMARNSSPV